MEVFRTFTIGICITCPLNSKLTNSTRAQRHPGRPAESRPFLDKANNDVKNEATVFFPLLKEQ